MSEPEPSRCTGSFMSFSVADFRMPRNESWDHEEEKAFVEKLPPVPSGSTPKNQPIRDQKPRLPVERDQMDYPEWIDDLPPWRNPIQKGNRYLYVHEQRQARIQGHH